MSGPTRLPADTRLPSDAEMDHLRDAGRLVCQCSPLWRRPEQLYLFPGHQCRTCGRLIVEEAS